MKILETLKLKSRLLLVFILITLGLILLGLVGMINTKDMKKRIDGLYFGSLMPVTELNDILYQYNAMLSPTVYKVKYDLISPQEMEARLSESLQEITTVWNRYKNRYKTDDELPYVNYTSSEINKANSYFYRVLHASKEGKDLTKLSLALLEKKVEHINAVIKKLLDYELSVARSDRKMFLESYETITQTVAIMLFVIIVGVLFVTYYVFRSIQKETTKLEIATKKLKEVNKKLQNASYTDSLTGLYNRRYFNYVYERELKRARREKKYISFMMIDIDYFKQYNDTYGHQAGDKTLIAVAKAIKECFRRPGDFVFRLGGEEFGVLLVDTDEASSAHLAQKLSKRVESLQIEHEHSEVKDVVTISIGIVSCIADETLDDEVLIKRADEMLYKAKEGGRNRFEITSDVLPNYMKLVSDTFPPSSAA